jgi:tetratricopeptide (TPR) repeat protein
MRAHTLNNVGVARVHVGDGGGIADLEESRRIARDLSVSEYVRATGNLASTLIELGELTRATELHEDALAAAREAGHYEPTRWLATELAFDRLFEGRWDDARAILEELLPEFDEKPFWIESQARVCAAWMDLANGAVGEARHQAERALEVARTAQNLQELSWPLALAARLHVEQGELGVAGELADELLERWTATGSQGSTGDWLIDLWRAAAKTDGEEALCDAIESALQTPWVRATAALTRRDFADAAELLAEIGARSREALVRLWAAEWLVEQGRRAEADAELERSLAFWRSVGATRYLRHGESLLAAAS